MPDAYSKLQQLIEKVSRGIFWDEDLQEEYDSKYPPLKEDALLSALNSLSLHNTGNYVITKSHSQKYFGRENIRQKPAMPIMQAPTVIAFFL